MERILSFLKRLRMPALFVVIFICSFPIYPQSEMFLKDDYRAKVTVSNDSPKLNEPVTITATYYNLSYRDWDKANILFHMYQEGITIVSGKKLNWEGNLKKGDSISTSIVVEFTKKISYDLAIIFHFAPGDKGVVCTKAVFVEGVKPEDPRIVRLLEAKKKYLEQLDTLSDAKAFEDLIAFPDEVPAFLDGGSQKGSLSIKEERYQQIKSEVIRSIDSALAKKNWQVKAKY